MDMKDAYKQAMVAQLKPLLEQGKIVVLTTLEDLAVELAEAVFQGLRDGAKLSSTPYDDITVIPAVNMIEPRVLDKIKEAI